MKIELHHFFQLLSNDTRLRCLLLIQQEDELCVCELVEALNVIQPKVSRHLATLRDAGVVADRRSGQWIYYRLHPDLPKWARQVLEAASAEATQREPHKNDLTVLTRIPNNPRGARCA